MSETKRNNSRHLTVLVVDDDTFLRQLNATMLGLLGYDVITASDGPAALEAAHQRQVDAVLLDVMMPGLNGFEVCRRLKHDPDTASVPVIMVTVLTSRESRQEGFEAGADDFLTKPTNQFHLLAILEQLTATGGARAEGPVGPH